jgi:3-oxoacyl-[acyl-carrier-protein] synthase III
MPTSKSVGIVGSGTYFPKKAVNVKDLAKQFNMDYERIFNDHGITNIHISDDHEDEYYMSLKAAESALNNSKLNPEDIDLVIYCKGITRQKSPRTFSSRILDYIGADDAYGFDIDGGFMGGLIGIQVASDIIKTNFRMNRALVVGAQEFDELYMFGNKASRIGKMVFGDGAAAVVLSHEAEINKILSSNFIIDNYTYLIDELFEESHESGPKLKRFFKNLASSPVIKSIRSDRLIPKLTDNWVRNSYNAIEMCLKSINLDVSDVDHFVKTQLSLKETEMLREKLKIPREKIHNASAQKGHLGHADILYNLHLMLQDKSLNNLDIIAVVTANYDCSSGAIIIRR